MDRIEALEERVAHLMRAVDDLSEVAARQAGEIEVLQRRLRLLMERAADQDGQPNAPEVIARPPHW